MQQFNPDLLKELYIPAADSHKGQNGKLLIVGGSKLFHAASIWALTTASRLVDMVFYSSVKENNELVQELKKEFRNGIVVERKDIDWYAQEAEAILIGPGMLRTEVRSEKLEVRSLEEIDALEDEGEQTYHLTKYLLKKYPDKKWVIDAGALQMIELDWLKQLHGQVLLTPHQGEFERVFTHVIPAKAGIQEETGSRIKSGMTTKRMGSNKVEEITVSTIAKKYNVNILLKGEKDIVCSPEKCIEISGGNAGMTKGGTGDVLAGLIAGLATKNDLFLAAAAGSYINKKAGEALYSRVGHVFNSSDLANEIPVVMKKLLF